MKLFYRSLAFPISLQLIAAFTPTMKPIARRFTRQHMVASTPDAVLEKVSTQKVLDEIIDESLRYSARRPIIMEFDPASKAIWNHWKGTIFAETWRSAVKHCLWALTVYVVFKRWPKIPGFLSGFDQIWAQTLTVTTFTLSFFVNQAYTLWRTCLTISRTLQGRLNDLMMGTTTYAKRIDTDVSSTYAPGSRELLQVLARYIRLFHILCYGSFTRSHRPLLTPQGMRRMVERGIMTPRERQILVNAQKVSATQRFNIVLMWIFRVILDGRRAGLVDGGPGFEQQTMANVQDIRGQANSIESALRGRMPFAYAHLVQVLIDCVLWAYPVSAYSSGMSLQIGLMGTFLLSFTYQGLADLSKIFLDPYFAEDFWSGDDALNVDTLLAETNSGSVRWIYGLEEMPLPYQSLADAKLEEYILPDEGYSDTEIKARIEEEKAKEAAETITMTQEEFAKKNAEIIEAAKEEYEETQLILKAPPGSDFVPGLDDEEESDECCDPLLEDCTETRAMADVVLDSTGMDRFEKFVDASLEEYQGSKDSSDGA